ncbi:MAG: hypothetical protein AB4372_04250 [Xenococcus sp. (in: cyanobacteria)]
MNYRQPITLKERLLQIKRSEKYFLKNNRRLKKLVPKRNNTRSYNLLIQPKKYILDCFNLKIVGVIILNLIVNIIRWIGHILLVSKNEPYIKQKRDRNGNLYWQVYDFTTNKSYTFGSEREVRAWIEERYNLF